MTSMVSESSSRTTRRRSPSSEVIIGYDIISGRIHPPLSTDRKARVRVSRGDDGKQVWTREFSDEEGAFESQMVHWFIGHNVNEHREFIDPGELIDSGGMDG
jgi:hypothetical protein